VGWVRVRLGVRPIARWAAAEAAAAGEVAVAAVVGWGGCLRR